MAIQCDQSDIYHNLPAGSNGTTLLYQTLYITSSGGPVMDGIYCDGTYIYTVSGGSGVVSNVETVASQGCGGSPTPTQTPPPPQGVEYSFKYRSNTSINACSGADDSLQRLNYYSNSALPDLNYIGDIIDLNLILYSDLYKTTIANNGYYAYSDGLSGIWFRVTGGSGAITEFGSC
jgi:hypothetical protein